MQKYLIAPCEDWVSTTDIDLVPCDEHESSPFYFYLVDYQEAIFEQEIHTYKRTIEQVNDASRIEDASLNLYELQENNHVVVFHRIDLIRDGKRFSVLDDDKISINRREKQLENHITNHRLTVSLSIDDLRVGDIIDLESTEKLIAGDHPLNGRFYYAHFWLNWMCPVVCQKVRIVNQSPVPIHIQHCQMQQGVPVASPYSVAPHEIFCREYHDLTSMPIENVVPGWLWSDHLLATTATTWPEISAYLFRYYSEQDVLQNDIGPTDRETLKLTGRTAEDIIKIVRFVQNEIRYKGENYGVFTHTPKKPSHTFTKRYGDCKDKSNLLVALLTTIGVDAHLTLVNSSYGIKLGELNPSPFHFNHMIVHVLWEGKHYYFDPTVKKQAGDLQHCATLDFVYGLVLTAEGADLCRLPHDLSREVFHLKHIYRLGQCAKGEERLTIQRTYFAHRADNMRYYLDSTEKKKLGEDFFKYAKDDTELELAVEQPITIVEDNIELNRLRTEEIYRIQQLEKRPEEERLHLLTTIYLDFPTTKITQFPIKIDLDGTVKHEIEVVYNASPILTPENLAIDNAWFSYSDSVKTDQHSIIFSTTATPKHRYVKTQDIQNYLKDVDTMRQRSMNNFPWKIADQRFLESLGYWMFAASGLIAYIVITHFY